MDEITLDTKQEIRIVLLQTKVERLEEKQVETNSVVKFSPRCSPSNAEVDRTSMTGAPID